MPRSGSRGVGRESEGGDVEKPKIDAYIISKQGAWILHVGESLLPPEIHTIFSLHEADRRTFRHVTRMTRHTQVTIQTLKRKKSHQPLPSMRSILFVGQLQKDMLKNQKAKFSPSRPRCLNTESVHLK